MQRDPDDRWITVLDGGPDAPVNPDDDPRAIGIYADRPDTAAMISVAEMITARTVPSAEDAMHRVTVCHPGPPPKTVHWFMVSAVPRKDLLPACPLRI